MMHVHVLVRRGSIWPLLFAVELLLPGEIMWCAPASVVSLLVVGCVCLLVVCAMVIGCGTVIVIVINIIIIIIINS